MNNTEIHEELESRIEQLDLNDDDICASCELNAYSGEGDTDLIAPWNLEDAIEDGEVHHYEMTVTVESYSNDGDIQKDEVTEKMREWFDELNLEIENEGERFSNYDHDKSSREASIFTLIPA